MNNLQLLWYVILTCRKWIQNYHCCELMYLDSEETNKLLAHVLINLASTNCKWQIVSIMIDCFVNSLSKIHDELRKVYPFYALDDPQPSVYSWHQGQMLQMGLYLNGTYPVAVPPSQI